MPAPPALFAPRGTTEDIERGDVFQPKFGSDGLLPAVVTDAATAEVLMLAWMNAEALALTIETGLAHFWTRSRGRIWKKGEESGNVLRVREIRTDCDQDAIWVRADVEGAGAACHTGERSCFYRTMSPQRTAAGAARLAPAASPRT
ncbi:MAG: phosphoribosyl-AMP cyclohydrolase [Hyphomicrobiaceae bacterium]|nr:phosphoribosyl-AMP cyclohydrolase [Hyphomicrobiaceae bacterium]